MRPKTAKDDGESPEEPNSPFSETPSAWDRPGFLLWHATLRWQREVAAALRPLGLTHAQFMLLGCALYLTTDDAAPSQREIADHAGTEAVMTSQVLRTLEERGWVIRKDDDEDARVRRIVITAEGRRQAARGLKALKIVDEHVFAPAGSQPRLIAMLRRLAMRDARGRQIEPVSR